MAGAGTRSATATRTTAATVHAAGTELDGTALAEAEPADAEMLLPRNLWQTLSKLGAVRSTQNGACQLG